jgi:hypothetical protein
MGRIIQLDRTGHTVLAEWTPTDASSVKTASDEFDKIVAGQFAYAPVKDKPGRFEQAKTFDPEVEEYIVRTPLVGG